jgi:hypothetical protein
MDYANLSRESMFVELAKLAGVDPSEITLCQRMNKDASACNGMFWFVSIGSGHNIEHASSPTQVGALLNALESFDKSNRACCQDCGDCKCWKTKSVTITT